MKRKYFVPVAYEMYGHVPIVAESMEDALDYAESHIDELPLPDNGEYVEGSFEVDADGLIYEDPLTEDKTFDEDLLKEARKICSKVFVDEASETDYIGKEDTNIGCRIRIYVTSWEYETPRVFRSNEALKAFLKTIK